MPLLPETSIKSLNNANFNDNETISDSLLEKFQNISVNHSVFDRVINRVTVYKELNVHTKRHTSISSSTPHRTLQPLQEAKNTNTFVATMGRYFNNLAAEQTKTSNKLADKFQTSKDTGFTLGISIVQGSDGNVYVKDIVPGGPGDKSGIKIGDQILAVDGISLINVPYDEAINILQSTKQQCELIISQLATLASTVLTAKASANAIDIYGTATRNILSHFNHQHRTPGVISSCATDFSSPAKSKSINNLNDKTSSYIRDDLELANNVPQLYRSPYKSRAEEYGCHEDDEVDSFVEEKTFDEDDIGAAMQLKKMGSLKNFHRYPMGNLTPSKSMPEIAGVNIEIDFSGLSPFTYATNL